MHLTALSCTVLRSDNTVSVPFANLDDGLVRSDAALLESRVYVLELDFVLVY